MGVLAPDKRRVVYNNRYQEHISNLQLKLGYNNVATCGDMNVAPTNRHVDRQGIPIVHLPSAKPWEQKSYADLIATKGLRNAATDTEFEFTKTWSSAGPLKFSMVLDHLLHPNPAHIKTGDKAIRIECFEVLPSTFNSDHYGLLFSAAYQT